MRFLDRFSVVLLDLHGTFMVGHDRFGPEEDYYETYLAAGGRSLDRESVFRVIRTTCEGILRDYHDPARFDDFPTLAEALRRYGAARDEHLPILEDRATRVEPSGGRRRRAEPAGSGGRRCRALARRRIAWPVTRQR